MSDSRVTRSRSRAYVAIADEHRKIRIPGVPASNHTNPVEILAQIGAQRAARAILPAGMAGRGPNRKASRTALTGHVSTANDAAERSTDAMARHGGRSPSLTIPEVIAELKVSRSTFYYWRQIGKAPRCVKLPNGEIRVRRADLDEWFDGLAEAA